MKNNKSWNMERKLKYFAKYLPVEGEIEKNDFYLYEEDDSINRVGNDISNWDSVEDELNHINSVSSYIKVKMSLCSRDIQVEDKFWDETEKKEFICTHISGEGDLENTWLRKGDSSHYVAKAAAFKVIGEISPDATWVREGDEFDEDECCFTYKPGDTIETGIVQIKGPCGHFH